MTWFEVGPADDGALRAFYAGLFGWNVQPASEGYPVVQTGGGIEGGIGRSRTGDPWVTFYVEVEDIQATLDRAEALGGHTVVPVTEIPGITWAAMFADPDGLEVGLTEAGSGDIPSGVAAGGGSGAVVDWFEVLGSDAGRVKSFYGELLGWSFEGMREGYSLVDTGAGRGVGGGVGAGDATSRWAIVNASVDDVGKFLRRAEEVGGTRVYGPIDIDDHTQAGVIRDPAGNAFGLYNHGSHD